MILKLIMAKLKTAWFLELLRSLVVRFCSTQLWKMVQSSTAYQSLLSYKEGIIPHIQIHDELDISVEDESHAKKIIDVMENAVTLEVPNKVDYEHGDNWGEIHG